MEYKIYIERDQFPDPQRFKDNIAWRSGIIDAKTGEPIDGQGDIATYEEARELLMGNLHILLSKGQFIEQEPKQEKTFEVGIEAHELASRFGGLEEEQVDFIRVALRRAHEAGKTGAELV